MNLPTQGQIYAGLRYAGTAAASVATVVTLVGIIPGDTAHAIVAAFQKLMTDLQAVVGDSFVLAGLVGPIAIGWLAKIGYSSASAKSQVASVEAMKTAHVLTSDPALAKGTPGVQIVAQSVIEQPTGGTTK